MKKIITAIGNSVINNELKNNSNYLILVPDIQFEEDLLDVLKNKTDTNILILNIDIIKKENIYDFIKKIKDINSFIKIIILCEKENEKLKNYLLINGIKDIFFGNEIKIQQIEDAIDKEKTTEEILTEEINNLKKIVLQEKNKNINNFKNIIFNKKKKNNNLKKEKSLSKIISIIGSCGVGKSIFTANFSLAFSAKKILIIDFDILNKSIKTIFGVRENVEEENDAWNKNEVEKLIIKISNNVDLICGVDMLFQDGYKIEKMQLLDLFEKLKENYDFILLDTSSECFFDYTKELIKYSDYSIFLVEANLIELKKSKKLLEIYINEWKIEKEKINIIFNKYNKNSIDKNILKKLFVDFNILGKIKANENYNYLINKNFKIYNKELIQEYKKIIEKIN